jgi:type VI secretion system secreted protein Hcp
MAEAAMLYLKANGSDVKGESTQLSLSREGAIECISYEYEVVTAREATSALATGRRQHQPLRIIKRIDKATPLLFKALAENQVMEGVLKFFRPNPTGDGTTEQFYTVEFKQGRINSIKQRLPNTIVPATSTEPPLEEVTFVFHTISWTYTNGGVTHEDSWAQPR